jgi:hypothetical protein
MHDEERGHGNFGTLTKVCPNCKRAALHIERMPWPERKGSIVLVMAHISRSCHCCGWEGAMVAGCLGPMIEPKYTRKKYVN